MPVDNSLFFTNFAQPRSDRPRSCRMVEHIRKVLWNGEGREKTMTERDYLAKQEVLRRLYEPEGDHQLHAALEHMRVHHPHLWEALHRVHLAHDADPSKLEEWR